MDSIDATEKQKQKAEVEAWIRMREEKGEAFLRGEEVRGDLSSYRDSVILDLGCGPRPFVEYFPARAAFMLDCCMHAYHREGLLQPSSLARVCCAAAMGEAIPIRDSVADHVFCLNMLDHTLDPEAVIRECSRVMRPWGFLHLHVDLGGEPTPCEPVVFRRDDLDRMFRGFELVLQEEQPPSNTDREAQVICIYRKPRTPETPESELAVPHGEPIPPLADSTDLAPFAARFVDLLACPACRAALRRTQAAFECMGCRRRYPIEGPIPLLTLDAAVQHAA
jgi:uncharacterized protein YbaR (Trm112 family)/SAM-dependent methyltransferase